MSESERERDFQHRLDAGVLDFVGCQNYGWVGIQGHDANTGECCGCQKPESVSREREVCTHRVVGGVMNTHRSRCHGTAMAQLKITLAGKLTAMVFLFRILFFSLYLLVFLFNKGLGAH